MIGAFHRFHGYNSLRGVYQRGQTVRGPMVNLKYASRGNQRPYRAAVVVSRKVSKSAVVRNRIRRRLYELVRRGQNVPPGMDLVFTVFDERLAELPPAKLQATVDELLKKAVS
jgi:ribonuclease P protein component